MLRLLAVLAVVLALALPWGAPPQAEAGFNPYCPPNYSLVPVESYQNHPLRRAAAKADKDGDGYVCFKYNPRGPGPNFVDDNGFEYYP